jgi:hypothetical protein
VVLEEQQRRGKQQPAEAAKNSETDGDEKNGHGGILAVVRSQESEDTDTDRRKKQEARSKKQED